MHAPNLPTEEVFTTPDPERVDGFVTATKPLFTSGTTVRGLRIRFEAGRAVTVEADHGAELVRGLTEHDEGAARLGEVALVDREGRIGPLNTVFYDTLIDENAASHIALGQGYELGVGGPDDLMRVNQSSIHVDFMIGGDEVSVTGRRRDGSEVALLRGGELADLAALGCPAAPGEVPEWLNGRDWKSRNGGYLVRGFESPPLRPFPGASPAAPSSIASVSCERERMSSLR